MKPILQQRALASLLGAACVCGSWAAQRMVPADTLRFQVEFSTLLGGSEYDDLREIIPLPDGSLLLGGQTVSADFPVTVGAVQGRYGGEPAGTGHSGVYGGDCFLARLSADGRKILASTFFGGSRQERDVYGMARDSRGNIVITTTTRSPDLPTTDGAFQRRYGGGEADVVVAKLSADLKQLIWCTYVGGSANETPRGGLAVDAADIIYVVGSTQSADFPTTPGVVGTSAEGDHDAFIVKLKSDGSGLVWSTRLGGRASEVIMGIRVDSAGNLYVAGHTQSDDFPITPGPPQAKRGGKSDCFVASLSADARTMRYATYLGGSDDEFAEHRLALLDDGSVLLTGVTSSRDFPATEGAWQSSLKGKAGGFATKVLPDGRRVVWSTFLGDIGWRVFPHAHDGWSREHLPGRPLDLARFPDDGGSCAGEVRRQGRRGVRDPEPGRFAAALRDPHGRPGRRPVAESAVGPKGEVYLIGKTAWDDFEVTAGAAQMKRKGNSDAFVVKPVPVL